MSTAPAFATWTRCAASGSGELHGRPQSLTRAVGQMQRRRVELAARRRSRGLTQESLARLLRVERSTVARWEAGDTAPRPWARPRLARLLEVTRDQLDWLLGVSFAEPAVGISTLRFADQRSGGDDPEGRKPTRGEAESFVGLVHDVAEVLREHGYPPVRSRGDVLRLQQALFRFIYQQEDP